jgi:hypothetical protein
VIEQGEINSSSTSSQPKVLVVTLDDFTNHSELKGMNFPER